MRLGDLMRDIRFRHAVPRKSPQQVDEIDLMLVAYRDKERLSTLSHPIETAGVEKPISVDREALKLLKGNFHARQLGVVTETVLPIFVCDEEIISDQRYGKLTSFEVVAGSYDLKSGGAGRYLTDTTVTGGVFLYSLEFMALISRFMRSKPQVLVS